MSGTSTPLDPWTPPPDGTEWMRHPRQRANYLAALCAHNEHTFREALDFLELWRGEMVGESATRPTLDNRGDAESAELIATLVRIAHDRRRLTRDAATSFKAIAAAVGISSERLAEAVRAALETDLAA
ncbi:MAG: hypothetical protein ACYDCS_04095 [Candidatus Dormibacteria bacterium]